MLGEVCHGVMASEALRRPGGLYAGLDALSIGLAFV